MLHVSGHVCGKDGLHDGLPGVSELGLGQLGEDVVGASLPQDNLTQRDRENREIREKVEHHKTKTKTKQNEMK